MTIIRDMPEDKYHAHPALGSTDLKRALRSLGHFKYARENPDTNETPAKRDGKILHCCILDPHTFDSRYVVLPEDAPSDLRRFRNAKKPSDDTLHSIAWWDAWEAANPGREIITAPEYERYMRCSDAVRKHPELRGYFDGPGDNELTMMATDPETGLQVKCRFDRRTVIGNFKVGLDPKSCMDARLRAFQRDAASYSYFLSAAYYLDVAAMAGEATDLFLLIAFEKEAPYGVKVYEPDDDSLAYGREQYRKALALIKHAQETDEYPTYDTSIEVLSMPGWAKE